MMTDTRSPREELAATFADRGLSADQVTAIVDGMTDEQVTDSLVMLAEVAAARDALRVRLAADPVLRRAICPATTWKDADARYDTAKRALRLVESAAELASKETSEPVTATAIAEALIALGGTVQDTIDMHGDDPRVVMWGSSFYAFRYRLQDAIAEVNTEVRREARRRQIEAEDAAWAARGMTRCDRCGGAGGAAHWPGFTCYDCDGRRCVPIGDAR
jgi:hypothetical protein